MSLTQEQIKHIARLAKLQLSDADTVRYQKDLNSIVDYIDMLNSVGASELAHIDETFSVLLPLRDDVEHKTLSREALLACSPKKIVNHQIAIDNIMH